MKKIIALLLASILLALSLTAFAENKTITDIDGHWAEDTIQKLINNEVISGYPDDTFRPDSNITGAEFIKLAVSNIEAFQYPQNYTGTWYIPYVEYARENRILTNYDLPNLESPLSREEMAVIALRTLKQIQVENIIIFNRDEVASQFIDWTSTTFSYRNDEKKYHYWYEVSDSISMGLITGKPGNIIDPQGNATRAEASVIIDRLRNEEVRKPLDFDLTHSFVVEDGWIDVPFKDVEMSEELGFELYQEFADYHVLANKDEDGNARPDRLEMAELAVEVAKVSDKLGTKKDIAYNIDSDTLWFNIITLSESKYTIPAFDVYVTFSKAKDREIEVRFDENKDWDYYKRHEAAIELIFTTYFESEAEEALARFKKEIGPHTMPYNNNYPNYDHYYLKNGRRVTWSKYNDNSTYIEFSVKP